MEREVGRHIIRPYRPGDRAAIRAICADTGFLGRPIDPVFEDRELFCDYLTSYYTDAEPESTFVCEIDGQVKGYVMGSRFPKRKAGFESRLLPGLVLRGAWRCVTRPYNAATRRYIYWLMTRARHEVPFSPPDVPHLHFNILPEARTLPTTRAIVDMFLQYLWEHGETQVYGQIVAYEARRGRHLFERWGFKVIDEREVTKYRELDPRKVYLYTILKDLTVSHSVYVRDAGTPAASDGPTLQ
jgi:hypothetical protein